MTFDQATAADIFSCKKCGECCKGYGGTYVTEPDIKAIAGYVNADADTFVADYCQMSGNKPVLAQGENGYCIFWDNNCTIHPVKPAMCRAWPFIKSVLLDINNWEIMAGSCPGIRTDIPNQIVETCVKEELKKCAKVPKVKSA
jgi:Fe-S-cluster containining protein